MSHILEATLLLLKDISLGDLKNIRDEIQIEIEKREKFNILSDSESSSDEEGEFSSDGEDMPIPKGRGPPPSPRRARTAYIFFTQDKTVRQRLLEKSPDAGFAEMSKLISDEWKKMTHKEKMPYIEMAEKDKKRAEIEKDIYIKSVGCKYH